MAGNQVEHDDTVNTGEGITKSSQEISKSKLACLEPLLAESNDNLSRTQKETITHLLQVNYDTLSSKENDESEQQAHEKFEISLNNYNHQHPYALQKTDTTLSLRSGYSQFLNNIHVNWWSLIFVTLSICLSSFIFGLSCAEASLIIDPSSPVNIGAVNHEYGLSPFEQNAMIPSSPLLGAALGSMSISLIQNKYSRKQLLLYTNIPILIGSIICITSISPLMIITALIFKGFGFGISSIVAPIMLAEMSPTPYRQFITMFHQLFVTFGILSAAICTLPLIHVHHGWRYICSIVIIPSILQLISYKFIPNSPRWLIANEKHENAKIVLRKFYGSECDEEVKEEADYIQNHIICDKSVKFKIKWLKPLFIGITLNILQQWTGINVVIWKSQTALKDQKIDENIFVTIILLYAINFVSTVAYLVCIKRRYSRQKNMFYIGTCLMLLMALFLGLIHSVYKNQQSLVQQLSISQTPLYLFGYAISLGPFTWLIISESFPYKVRIRFVSICVFFQWSCNAIFSLSADETVHQYLDGNVGSLYFIFCGLIIFSIVLVNKGIPDTTGKSLEDAVKMYIN